MKLPAVETMSVNAEKQTDMAPNIIDTMHVYFRSDRRTMGYMEQSIMSSIERYFEKRQPTCSSVQVPRSIDHSPAVA
jgi:hypothetical protein